MRANIRQAVQPIIFIAADEQRFIEEFFKEGKGVTAACFANLARITRELPGAGKNPFFCQLKKLRRFVDICRNRPGF